MSKNIPDLSTKEMVTHQTVDGSPTVATFVGGVQDVESQNIETNPHIETK